MVRAGEKKRQGAMPRLWVAQAFRPAKRLLMMNWASAP